MGAYILIFHVYELSLYLQAKSVDTDKKTVTFDDGSVQSYDQLLISTGCRYRQCLCRHLNISLNIHS